MSVTEETCQLNVCYRGDMSQLNVCYRGDMSQLNVCILCVTTASGLSE